MTKLGLSLLMLLLGAAHATFKSPVSAATISARPLAATNGPLGQSENPQLRQYWPKRAVSSPQLGQSMAIAGLPTSTNAGLVARAIFSDSIALDRSRS